MSTTFGVIPPSAENEPPIEVAFRNSGGISFINPLAELLPDSTPVIPLDNSAQGIYSIGDIKAEIVKQQNK
jgi:hypothetical protein